VLLKQLAVLKRETANNRRKKPKYCLKLLDCSWQLIGRQFTVEQQKFAFSKHIISQR
jgi:hypothetical protein